MIKLSELVSKGSSKYAYVFEVRDNERTIYTQVQLSNKQIKAQRKKMAKQFKADYTEVIFIRERII